MQRSRTVQLNKDEVDFMVQKFSCHDDSVLTSLGKHCKEMTWKISIGAENKPVELKMTVDQQIMGSPSVSISCDGEQIYPESLKSKSGTMKREFEWVKSFRGTLRGLAAPDFFEVRNQHSSMEQWFKATLTEQREDGDFKAILQMPDGKGGFHAVDVPAVKVENVREGQGKKLPVSLPYRTIKLYVPFREPMAATVNLDNEPVTHFFARPTPPPQKSSSGGSSRVLFQVAKDRSSVSTERGHAFFSHFMSGQVRGIKQDADDLMHSWTFQVGPLAEHTVAIRKKHLSSTLISLDVDGELLCEATPEDIDCHESTWQCHFRLVGEKFVDFEVYESDGQGSTLDTKGTVSNRTKFTQDCYVVFQMTEKSLLTAKLYIGDNAFAELPEARPPISEEPIRCHPGAITATYGISVPYKVGQSSGKLSPTFMQQLGNATAEAAAGDSPLAGLFSMCACCKSSAVPDEKNLEIKVGAAKPGGA